MIIKIKKTRTSTLATDITSRGSSNISTSFESSFVGSQVLSDTPNKYEPYLDLNEHNILLEDINKIRAENQETLDNLFMVQLVD